jgi:U32 family peptidase
VARAYRLAIDQPERTDEAKKMLHYDMGRPKTTYFFGGKISGAFTENPSTGIYIGEIMKIQNEGFAIQTSIKLQQSNSAWIRSPLG